MRALCVLGLCAPLLVACATRDTEDVQGSAQPAAPDTEEPAQVAQPTSVTSTRSPTRAEVERATDVPEPEPATTQPRVPSATSRVRLELVRVDVPEGEDGRGNVVPARDAVQIDLVHPDGFGGRARDPVLRIGQLRFTRYAHPAPDRMRFWIADRSILPAGAEVVLEWGDDRSVITSALEVPR